MSVEPTCGTSSAEVAVALRVPKCCRSPDVGRAVRFSGIASLAPKVQEPPFVGQRSFFLPNLCGGWVGHMSAAAPLERLRSEAPSAPWSTACAMASARLVKTAGMASAPTP